MNIMSIVRARPQFIKHISLNSLLDDIENLIVHTGQHFDDNMF